jgi:small nuclear ribonucleoprotein (snRNP)-like protein
MQTAKPREKEKREKKKRTDRPPRIVKPPVPHVKHAKLMSYINERIKVSISGSRTLLGDFRAFDRHYNIVLDDCYEYRQVRLKPDEAPVEMKRHLGLTLVRGVEVVAFMVQAGAGARSGVRKKDQGKSKEQIAAEKAEVTAKAAAVAAAAAAALAPPPPPPPAFGACLRASSFASVVVASSRFVLCAYIPFAPSFVGTL